MVGDQRQAEAAQQKRETLETTDDNNSIHMTRVNRNSSTMKFLMDGGNPLAPIGSPAINAEFTVTLQGQANSASRFAIQGEHDGFPAYEFYVNANRVYEFDPKAQGQTPFSLFPPMEWDVNVPLQSMPPRLGQPQYSAGIGAGGGVTNVTLADLQLLFDEAKARWGTVVDAALIGDRAARTELVVDDLADNFLGLTTSHVGGTYRITIDRDAAGFGWFIDPTADDESEFSLAADGRTFVSTMGGPAEGKADLLTVLMHEFGHVLSMPDLDNTQDAASVLNAVLQTGMRRVPATGDVDWQSLSSFLGDHTSNPCQIVARITSSTAVSTPPIPPTPTRLVASR